MQAIPDVLIENILSRLPVKALLRFRCVCKSWRTLIDHPYFIHTHYSLHYALHKSEATTPLFIWRVSSALHENLDDLNLCHILSKPQGHGDDVLLNMTAQLKRDIELAFNNPGHIDFCLGIANGIVCFQMSCACDFENNLDEFGWEQCLGLWNPATRDVKILPHVDAPDKKTPSMDVVCFGFDPLSNDFKVVVQFFIKSDGISSPIMFCGTDDDTDDDVDSKGMYKGISIGISIAHELYSLSTNSWKRLRYLDAYTEQSQMDACLNGVHYWASPKNSYLTFCIVSFNFSTEVFKVSDPPQCAALQENCSPYQFIYQIGLYKDYLALFLSHKISNEAATKVDIWVATKFDDEDFGVPLEWQCVLVIEPLPTSPMNVCVMTTQMDGLLLLKTSDVDPLNGECSLYDPETRNIKNLGISCPLNCFRYVESLFPISRKTSQT